MNLSEVKHLPKVDHTPAELGEASKLLLKAAALIEKHGWTTHAQFNEAGQMCAYGALVMATTGYAFSGTVSCPAGIEAVKRLEAHVGAAPSELSLGWGVANWNNGVGRTQAEVVAKLRAVALGG